MKNFKFFWTFAFLICSTTLLSQEAKGKNDCNEQEEFIETTHQITIEGKPVSYKAIAGNFLLKDEKCQPTASIFFMSYTKEGTENLSDRPITFCFNGGPGSSSVWLHLGILGPKRVHLKDNGDALAPYHLVENEFSLLDQTDLVFIDPVSTGFSRAIPFDNAKNFHGVQEDVDSIANFIQLYLSRYGRWESPKFIIGESYGTTRAAKLVGELHDRHFIHTNGVILISAVLNFQSIDFAVGNDLPNLLFLPSYTATAWYHKKLSPELQANLSKTLQASRDFVINEYATALFKGDLLKHEEKKKITAQLSKFTGLSPQYIENSRFLIDLPHFSKELLRDQKKVLGRFDSRFTGIDPNLIGETMTYDPSMDGMFGVFTSTINHYIRTDLKCKKEGHYKILTPMQHWNYGCENQYLNVGDTLQSIMTKNPGLRVFVGNGIYDLATPFFATEYTFNHLGLDPTLLSHVTMESYEAGHMMYIHGPSLIKMKNDLSRFYIKTLADQEQDEKEAASIQR